MKRVYLLTACICLLWTAQAQDSLKTVQLDDVVITGNKTETSIEKSGKTIFKLDRKQIEANRGKDVTDLLNELPGVQIDGNFATPGTNISYRVRGASSEQTLILIDGVPLNDPSGLAQTYDLRLLDLEQVESIEVLKGGLSSLYGTGAAAGVISITTKKASKETATGSINTEYGSFNTLNLGANVSGKTGGLTYLVSGSYKSSDGFSSAQDTLGTENFDDDGIESTNFFGKFGYEFSDNFLVDFSVGIDQVKSDFDGGAFRDDDSELELNMNRFTLSPKYKWTGGSITANISYHTNERIFDQPDFFDPTARSISNFNGNTFQTDVIIDQNLSDRIKLIGGVNIQRPVWEPEDADSEDFTMIDPYASLIFDIDNLNIQVGGRLNNHSDYGSNFVWNLNPSYLIELKEGSKLKLLGSYSTAFLAPSLNQLYAGDFGFLATDAGNPDLDPQESENVELGIELLSNNKLQLGTVYFYRKDKDAIDFLSTPDFSDGGYENIDGFTEVDGLEINATYAFNPQLSLAGHYTYTRSLTSDLLLRRVPENKFGFTLSALPIENLLVKITHLHVGEVPENDEVTLEAFDLFDGFVSYTINEKLSFSGSINNIFDTEYVDRFGWNTAERNYNIGVRYSF